MIETEHKPLVTVPSLFAEVEDANVPTSLMFPRKQLILADVLSRGPADHVLQEIIDCHVNALETLIWPRQTFAARRAQICKQTIQDPQLALLLQYIRSGWPASKHQTSDALKGFWSSRHLFTEVEGMILGVIRLLFRCHKG